MLSPETAGPGPAPDLTLRAEYPGRVQARLLNPSATIHESNLRSGCTVEVVSSLERRDGDDLFGTAAAIVRVLEGPDAGNEFTIATGVNYVGGALCHHSLLSASSRLQLGPSVSWSRTWATSRGCRPRAPWPE